ncbi:Phosphoglycerate kinase [hydrothermal vent metagenome]|uniref:phosphoglycerate kinase n=1 Tax=hydrothermal vent metagenome TaxID=652676 RepID=A0A3B1CCD7_9ZZZZ
MNKLSIDKVDLAGKRVFIRVDFNVPLAKGEVTDDTRIAEALPTIKYASDAGAKVIVASHLGRPKGERKPEFSLTHILNVFEHNLGRKVTFVEDCVGEKVQTAVDAMAEGDILLLENLRFYKEETENDDEFSKKLASLADVYINDAFGTAHRSHASTAGMTKYIKTCAAGFLMKNEIEFFNKAMGNPERPVAVILGGAKISTKLGVVENLLDKCEILIVGGAMAFTFLKALGFNVGPNMVEDDMLKKVMGVMAKTRQKKIKLYLPVDFILTDSIEGGVARDTVTRQELPEDMIAADIGPATSMLYKLALKNAKTIIWNGPMGVFEKLAFANGTLEVAKTVAESSALSVVGGGDSVTAVNKAGLKDKMSFLSTGGGAFLEQMEGRELPGISALNDA